MQKSFKQRLAALEALEAEQESESGRRLEVFLYIRPIDYFTMFDAEPFDAERCAQIDQEYGLDQIDWEQDRVHIMGGTWPGVPSAQSATIVHIALADGYGCRIDDAPWVESEPGAPRWSVAISEAVEALRVAQRTQARARLITLLESGALVVRPFNATCDLRQYEAQISTCVELRAAPATDRDRSVLCNTLDWYCLRCGGPFAQSTADALCIMQALELKHLWLGADAVWPQADRLRVLRANYVAMPDGRQVPIGGLAGELRGGTGEPPYLLMPDGTRRAWPPATADRQKPAQRAGVLRGLDE